MKKIIILCCFINLSSSLIAQTTIYSQDFGLGVPAGWAITDSTGAGKVWTYDTNGPSGNSANPADTLKSTTYSNGIMIMDDDFYGQTPGFDATALISTAINCSVNNKVKVKFQDFYRHFVAANSQAILFVSNDSINWIDVYHAEAGLGNNNPTPNPHLPDINISAIAANQATVYLKFLYRGDWGYYWELDDIEVYQPAPVGIDENDNLLSHIKFFPNPSNGIINVSELNEEAIITVSNQAGQIVIAKKFDVLKNEMIDLSAQPEGLYHIYLKSTSSVSHQIINIRR